MTLQKIQIIKRKIDAEKLSGKTGDEGKYYQNLRSSIKKSLNRDADLVMIDLIPPKPIQEIWMVECLLDLQSEFTKILLIPNNSVNLDVQRIEEMKNHLRVSEILKSV